MARAELTREAVLRAIGEFDRLGRDTFLETYGFRGAKGYFLVHEGESYDSKAIAAVAYRYLPGHERALTFNELSGGVSDAAAKLSALGFHVTSPAENPDWTHDEHVLALHLYMQNPASPPGKTSKEILELSALLNELGRREGVTGTEKYRNPNGVYMKLMNFRRLDPAFQAAGKAGLGRGAKGEQAVWDRYANDPAGLAAAAAAIRLAVADPTVSLTQIEEDYEAEEGRVILKLHRSRERDAKLSARKKAQALAETGKLSCEVCSFDFARRYGAHGANFIEAHHRKPVSSLKLGDKTKLADLALVCSNCHRMLHRFGRVLGVQDLRAMLLAQEGSLAAE